VGGIEAEEVPFEQDVASAEMVQPSGVSVPFALTLTVIEPPASGARVARTERLLAAKPAAGASVSASDSSP
jgi:hypothetical protein